MNDQRVPLIPAIQDESLFILSGNFVEDFKLRMRFLDFSTIPIKGYSFPESHPVEGVLWRLMVEVVNIGKIEFKPSYLDCLLKVMDSDECIYSFRDHRELGSLGTIDQYKRFSSDAKSIQPKFKAVGAIAVELPDQDSNYCIIPYRKDYMLDLV